MNRLYPIFLDLENRPCVVVGGGEVARRKIDALLECGARVRVVSPACDPEVEELAAAGKIEWARRAFRPEDLEGAQLVVAATDDDATNRAVRASAARRKVWCNVVDVPELCDFYVPATVRQGDLKIAISSNGKAPALTAGIRKMLERQIGPQYARVAERLGALRAKLREKHPDDAARRMEIMRQLVDSDALFEALNRDDAQALDAILESWTSCLLD